MTDVSNVKGLYDSIYLHLCIPSSAKRFSLLLTLLQLLVAARRNTILISRAAVSRRTVVATLISVFSGEVCVSGTSVGVVSGVIRACIVATGETGSVTSSSSSILVIVI